MQSNIFFNRDKVHSISIGLQTVRVLVPCCLIIVSAFILVIKMTWLLLEHVPSH